MLELTWSQKIQKALFEFEYSHTGIFLFRPTFIQLSRKCVVRIEFESPIRLFSLELFGLYKLLIPRIVRRTIQIYPAVLTLI